jgi:hypothetical protein
MILKFPEYMELSNTIYTPDSKDAEIKMHMVPYPIDISFAGTNFRLLKCRVVWKVHLVEEEARVVEEQDAARGRTAEDDLLDAFRGMNV